MNYDKTSKYHEILEKTHGRDFIKTINTDWRHTSYLKYKPKPKTPESIIKPYKPKAKQNPVTYLEALWAK